MKIINKISILTLLSVCTLITVSCDNNDSTNTISGTTTGDTTPNLPTTYTGYYASMTNNLGSTFRSTLNSIITSNLKSSSYDNAWTILSAADAYDNENIECFYSGRVIPKTAKDGSNTSGQSVVWNREHVWAKSHGFGDSTSNYAYYDAHHLHATEKDINSARGNLPFDNVTNGSSDLYGNSWSASAFEPRDEIKGDVARSLFYMVVRYDSQDLDLELEDEVTNVASSLPKLGKLSTLLEWAYNDPVSEEEKNRNEIVYTYQGNRNPFIDNPEFVYYLYTNESNQLDVTLDNLSETLNKTLTTEELQVRNVIDLINSISVVTSSSKSKIEAAYAAYEALSESQKLEVINYPVLVNANTTYESLYGGDTKFQCDLTSVSKFSGYKSDYSFTINGLSMVASNCYSNGEFRLGSNKAATLPTKYQASKGSDGSYLEFEYDDVSSISYTITNIFGTVSNCYLLYSTNGVDYTILQDFGSIAGAKTIVATFDQAKTGYFALVVTGSLPRVSISTIAIK